jgi:hypothetical protein
MAVADERTMTMERMASLFTRNDDSVRLEVRTTADGVQLLIDGPGEATSRFDFPAGTAVDSFRREYEQKLLDDGYRLQVVAERRVQDETRSGDRRRRR